MKHEIDTDMKLNSNTQLHGGGMWNISQWLTWTNKAMVVFHIQLWWKQMDLTRNPWDLVNATNLKAPSYWGDFKISIRDLSYIFPLRKTVIIKTPRYFSFFSRDYCWLSSWDAKDHKRKAPGLGCWMRHQTLIVRSFSKWISSDNYTKT